MFFRLCALYIHYWCADPMPNRVLLFHNSSMIYSVGVRPNSEISLVAISSAHTPLFYSNTVNDFYISVPRTAPLIIQGLQIRTSSEMKNLIPEPNASKFPNIF